MVGMFAGAEQQAQAGVARGRHEHIVDGIVAGGCENRVINNDVMDTTHTDGVSSFGIYVYGSDNLVVNNRITASDFGIFKASGTAKCRDNLTSGVTAPFSGCTLIGVND